MRSLGPFFSRMWEIAGADNQPCVISRVWKILGCFSLIKICTRQHDLHGMHSGYMPCWNGQLRVVLHAQFCSFDMLQQEIIRRTTPKKKTILLTKVPLPESKCESKSYCSMNRAAGTVRLSMIHAAWTECLNRSVWHVKHLSWPYTGRFKKYIKPTLKIRSMAFLGAKKT